ncbi:MAG: transcription termination/antitermination NusG family protein, partial [Planctomycetota bacterium]
MVSDNLEQPVDPSVDSESHPVQSSTPEISAKPSLGKSWYVVKVQSGREESIKEALEKRVKIDGLEEFFGQIHIPIEKVTEMRRGKRVS